MKATNRVRRVLTAGVAAIALAGTALGTAAALDLGGSESHNGVPAPDAGDSTVTDAGVNPWEANDLAVVLQALEQGAESGP
jgi:hypothetical protein